MSTPKLGNLAPAFTLKDQNGDDISLKDFRGKERCAVFLSQGHDARLHRSGLRLRDSLQSLEQSEAVALGVSPDPVTRLKKFEEKEDSTSPFCRMRITRSQTNMACGA